MRRGLLVAACFALLLVAPGSAGNDKQEPTDGCLVVENGQGIVTVSARGGIFGRFDSGSVIIEDLVPNDTKGPKVFNAPDVVRLGDTKIQYTGLNVRFRFTSGGSFRVRVHAVGIDLSAIGRGWATLRGSDELGAFTDPGTYSADEASLCAKGFKPLPEKPVRIVLGAAGNP